MEISIICNIFDIDNSDDIDNNDKLIINKISKYGIEYLNECYNRSLNHDKMYIEIVNKYITSFSKGVIDHSHKTIFESWILNNDVIFWDIIIKDTKDLEYILDIYNNCDRLDDIKYKNIERILSLKKTKSIVSQSKYKNGIEEETIGPLSWINNDIDKVYTTLKPLYEDERSLSALLKKVNRILKLNKYYSYSNLEYLNDKKTCSVEFMFILFNIILRLNNKFKDKELKYKKEFPREEYKTYKSDCVYTKLFVVTSRFYYIFHNTLYNIYNNLNNTIIDLRIKVELFIYSPDILETLLSKIDVYMDRFNFIKKNILDNSYDTNIQKFYDKFIDNKIKMGSDFMDSLIMSSLKKILIFKKPESSKLIDYYFDCIKNIKIQHISYKIITYICNLIDIHGYNNKENRILESFLLYLSEININEIDEISQDLHDHLVNMLYKMSLLCINDSVNINDHIMINKSIYKFSSIIIIYLDKLKIYEGIDGNILIEGFNMLLICFNRLLLIANIKDFGYEIITPITNILLYIIRNDEKYNSLLKTVFMIINNIKDNKIIDNNFNDDVNHIIKLINDIDLDDKTKNDLSIYFNKIKENNNNNTISEIPEKFLDPLLYTIINEPIMIPKVNLIFDKSSIISHLYHDNINPYTREPLTINEVEEYNKKQDIIDRINKYKKEYEKWKLENK